MKTKVLTLIVLFLLSPIISAPALGPPRASLEQGQFEIAVEYSNSQFDVEINDNDSDTGETTKTLESNMLIARTSYGVTENLDIYALLGLADNKVARMDFGRDVTYGLGTKCTFLKNDTLSFGAIFETSWKTGNASGTMDFTELTEWYYFEEEYSAKLSYNEIMFALGPTWEVTERLRFYGGAFFYRLNGDIDVDIEWWDESISLDLEEKSRSGGYFGSEWDIHPNVSWYGEIRYISDMWVIGTGVSWKL
jgi:opacity protein-like surface antigen